MDKSISTQVREARAGSRLTQQQLASLAGVSRPTVGLVEREQTDPSLSVLQRLADALGRPLTIHPTKEPTR